MPAKLSDSDHTGVFITSVKTGRSAPARPARDGPTNKQKVQGPRKETSQSTKDMLRAAAKKVYDCPGLHEYPMLIGLKGPWSAATLRSAGVPTPCIGVTAAAMHIA